MKKLILLSLILSHSHLSQALVTSPGGSRSDQWNIELKTTLERGKVEPNENRSSFQSAQIDVHQLGIAKGLEVSSFGTDHFARLDLKYFKSGEERVGAQTFYQADTGNAVTFSYGFNLIHEPSFVSGLYLSVSPVLNFNKRKFSVPRMDLWSIGTKTSVQFSERFFSEENLHYGSGIPGQQNSYLAFSHLFGFRLLPTGPSYVVLKWGPYAELDTSERRDESYDQAFSPPGQQDRIRSMKVGHIMSIEAPLSKESYGALSYVQKIGGYDAPATNAVSLSLGFYLE